MLLMTHAAMLFGTQITRSVPRPNTTAAAVQKTRYEMQKIQVQIYYSGTTLYYIKVVDIFFSQTKKRNSTHYNRVLTVMFQKSERAMEQVLLCSVIF